MTIGHRDFDPKYLPGEQAAAYDADLGLKSQAGPLLTAIANSGLTDVFMVVVPPSTQLDSSELVRGNA